MKSFWFIDLPVQNILEFKLHANFYQSWIFADSIRYFWLNSINYKLQNDVTDINYYLSPKPHFLLLLPSQPQLHYIVGIRGQRFKQISQSIWTDLVAFYNILVLEKLKMFFMYLLNSGKLGICFLPKPVLVWSQQSHLAEMFRFLLLLLKIVCRTSTSQCLC